MVTLGVAEDKICMSQNQTVKLSAQEIIDCDMNSFGCDGGYINKVLKWGKTKGFILDECMPYTGKKTECEVDHLESNVCRIESQFYRVNDFCIAYQPENIMREIFKNGPVVGQMQPFTDFLAYSDGSYHKSPESFKFQGQHIIKIVGWSKSMDGTTEWIIENTWGEDWGENGYAKVLGRQDVGVDLYAIGMSINPYSQYDLLSMQQMVDSTDFGGDDYENLEGYE
jgi:cathepsin B